MQTILLYRKCPLGCSFGDFKRLIISVKLCGLLLITDLFEKKKKWKSSIRISKFYRSRVEMKNIAKLSWCEKWIKQTKTGFTTLISPLVFSRSNDVLWRRNVEVFHKFMCAQSRCQYAVFTHRLIDRCRLLTTPKWSKTFVFFLFPSFFWCSQNLSCRYSHLNSKSAFPTSAHITFYLFLFRLKTFIFISQCHAASLSSVNKPNGCLYNGMSPDLRWDERVNESKLSVSIFLSWWCSLLCVYVIFLFQFTVTEWESGNFIFGCGFVLSTKTKLEEEHLLGLTEYANFFTKFENRTAKMMTGKPTNCTGSSKSGALSCARTTALSLKSIILNISAEKSASDGNITCSCIFFIFCFVLRIETIWIWIHAGRYQHQLSSDICTRKPNQKQKNQIEFPQLFSIIKFLTRKNTEFNRNLKIIKLKPNMWFGIWLTACVTNWYRMILLFLFVD